MPRLSKRSCCWVLKNHFAILLWSSHRKIIKRVFFEERIRISARIYLIIWEFPVSINLLLGRTHWWILIREDLRLRNWNFFRLVWILYMLLVDRVMLLRNKILVLHRHSLLNKLGLLLVNTLIVLLLKHLLHRLIELLRVMLRSHPLLFIWAHHWLLLFTHKLRLWRSILVVKHEVLLQLWDIALFRPRIWQAALWLKDVGMLVKHCIVFVLRLRTVIRLAMRDAFRLFVWLHYN